LGVLKAKLAKYRSQLLEPAGKKGEKGEGFDVLKSGDARVALIGFPSVGKVSGQPLIIIKQVNLQFIHFSRRCSRR
jgi:ribosome-interacting GTPase 1